MIALKGNRVLHMQRRLIFLRKQGKWPTKMQIAKLVQAVKRAMEE